MKPELSDLSPGTPNKKKWLYYYLALLPILLVISLIAMRDSGIGLSEITWLYAIVFGWLVSFPIIIWVRWIAKTAELAGRSYLGFMILGIFFPVIATIIVLIFKKPSN